MKKLYKALLKAPEIAPRGMVTRELLNVALEFGYGQERIYHPLFNDNSHYLEKELEWYARGDFNDLSIVEEAKIWKSHVMHNMLWSNYGGWLWGNAPAYQGLVNAVTMMRADRNTRRAVAYIGNNGTTFESNRDVPCTLGLQFIIRNNQLYTRVWMRSQDAYLGLRNDLTAFWFFARIFAKLTNSKPLILHLDVGSFHVYENNIPKIQAAVDNEDDIQLLSHDYGNLIDTVVAKVESML